MEDICICKKTFTSLTVWSTSDINLDKINVNYQKCRNIAKLI